MWARRDSGPLRQHSTPSSTPATPCSFLKVGGVCESARRVLICCASYVDGVAAFCIAGAVSALNSPTPDATSPVEVTSYQGDMSGRILAAAGLVRVSPDLRSALSVPALDPFLFRKSVRLARRLGLRVASGRPRRLRPSGPTSVRLV